MAGWLKRESDESGSEGCVENNGGEKIEWSFTEFLAAFLGEVYGVSHLRPLPPIIGEGQVVDLLRLRIGVRKRGGYSSVTNNGLWSSVAVDCGLDFRVSAALKLVYVKYLDSLDRWLRKIEKFEGGGVEGRYLGFCRFLMELDSDPKVFVSGITSKVDNDDKKEFGGANEDNGFVDVESFDGKWSNSNGGVRNANVDKKQCVVDEFDGGGDFRMDEDSVSIASKVDNDDEKEFGGSNENNGFVDVESFDGKWSNSNGGIRNANVDKKQCVVDESDGGDDFRMDKDSVSIASKVDNVDEFVELKKEFGGPKENNGLVDVKSSDGKWSNTNGGVRDVDIDEFDGGGDLRMDEDSVSKKRKRECFTGMLSWIREVAKDPGGIVIEALPERQKWKFYANELPWKQILLVREAMLLKKNVDAGSQQSDLQKKQKMHPSMYDDDPCNSEKLRCSQRLIFSKDSSRKPRERGPTESSSSGWQSDEDYTDKKYDSSADSPTYLNSFRRKRIPLGPNHQAELPDFQGADYESESKWLGVKFWPLDKTEQTKQTLIERDRIGKGRQESCGCQFPGSVDCVRFHVREKRMKTKLELGSAFYLWKLDLMGEEVAFSWTQEDQKTFHHVVQSNPLSSEKYFWVELFKNFPKKGREGLVSYYFNVFVLRRRGMQNRTSPCNIDSDDEGSEYGPIGNRFGASSIFCSPKKSSSNCR